MAKNSSTITTVEALAKIASEYELAEIKFKEDNLEIEIIRSRESVCNISSNTANWGSLQQPISPINASEAPVVAADIVEDLSKHPGAIISPMIGIVYRAPDTNSSNYVEVGTSVKQGDTLMLIEAMKVFNPIKAHKDGVISKIFVDSETAVEFGEVLVIIE